MMNDRTAAFTLIELLVVISIIALLIGLLLPSLSKARETANLVQCGTQQRQVAIAAVTYATDEKGHFPPTIVHPAHINSELWSWPNQLNYGTESVGRLMGPYLQSGSIFVCPLSPGEPDGFQEAYAEGTPSPLNGSYNLLWNFDGFLNQATNERFRGPSRLEQNSEEHDLLFVDLLASHGPFTGWRSAHPDQHAGSYQAFSNYPGWRWDEPANHQYRGPAINAAYRDGHVARFDFADTVAVTHPFVAQHHTFFIPERW